MVMANSGEANGETQLCFICGRPASLQCPSCEDVWFCSSTHGTVHHRPHLSSCFPWRVETIPGKGRVMVTTRDVLAGETLFMEEPIVHGPNQGRPICLTCYSTVSLDYLCEDCGYPMCDSDCARDPAHRAECEVLARGERPTFQDGETEAYHCILPLRLLLLARQDPERFSFADHLMDHEEEREGSEDWLTTERTVVERLLVSCQAAHHEGMSQAEVRRAVGVLEVNCYEVFSFISKSESVSCGLRGCYPAASLLSHSCVANSRHVWGTSPPYTNTCIATVDIPAGQEVVTSYVHPTTSTQRRRAKLRAGWYFDCDCERCGSRTELGSQHSTLRCPACQEPSLLPSQPLSPLTTPWQCQLCGLQVPGQQVNSLLDKLFADIKKVTEENKFNVEGWLHCLHSVLKVVHPHHEAVIEIGKFLIPILCRGPGMRTEHFPIELVKRKLELANIQLAVLTVVDPGYSKSRVKVLYEIVETELYLLFKEDPDQEKIKQTASISKARLSDIIRVLERLKPSKGFETMIVKASRNMLDKCEEILSSENITEDLVRWKEQSWCLLDLCSY